METTYAPESVFPIVGGCFTLAIYLVIIVVTVVAFCKICGKAGYHWAMGLLMLVPIGNLVMILILAFGEWPIERQLRACRQSPLMPPSGEPHQNFRGL